MVPELCSYNGLPMPLSVEIDGLGSPSYSPSPGTLGPLGASSPVPTDRAAGVVPLLRELISALLLSRSVFSLVPRCNHNHPDGRPAEANPHNAGASASVDTVKNVICSSPQTAGPRRSGSSAASMSPVYTPSRTYDRKQSSHHSPSDERRASPLQTTPPGRSDTGPSIYHTNKEKLFSLVREPITISYGVPG